MKFWQIWVGMNVIILGTYVLDGSGSVNFCFLLVSTLAVSVLTEFVLKQLKKLLTSD